MATTTTYYLPEGDVHPFEHMIPGTSELLGWLDEQEIDAGRLVPDSALKVTGKAATVTRYVLDEEGNRVPDDDAPRRFQTETVDVPVTAAPPKMPKGAGWDKPNRAAEENIPDADSIQRGPVAGDGPAGDEPAGDEPDPQD